MASQLSSFFSPLLSLAKRPRSTSADSRHSMDDRKKAKGDSQTNEVETETTTTAAETTSAASGAPRRDRMSCKYSNA
jgi:hypothetical protein